MGRGGRVIILLSLLNFSRLVDPITFPFALEIGTGGVNEKRSVDNLREHTGLGIWLSVEVWT